MWDTFRHILGHFGCGQLTYPHCSWASLLGSLPVLSAHSFTSNWQLPFLNHRKGENDRRNYFMTKLHKRTLPGMWGSNPRPSTYQATSNASVVTRLNLFLGYSLLILSKKVGREFVACKGNPIYALKAVCQNCFQESCEYLMCVLQEK